jgi:hypothetical protein
MARRQFENTVSWFDEEDLEHLVSVDMVTELQATTTAEATQHPIETGGNIADHVILKPAKLKIEIVQTQVPFPLGPNLFEAVPLSELDLTVRNGPPQRELRELKIEPRQPEAGFLDFLAVTKTVNNFVAGLFKPSNSTVTTMQLPGRAFGTGSIKIHTFQPTQDQDRITTLYDELLKAQTLKRSFRVSWLGKVYPAMVMESLGYKRSHTEELGRFSLEFSQVLTVTAETALGLVAAKPANVRNTKDKDKGQQDAPVPRSTPSAVEGSEDAAGDAKRREKRDDFSK